MNSGAFETNYLRIFVILFEDCICFVQYLTHYFILRICKQSKKSNEERHEPMEKQTK